MALRCRQRSIESGSPERLGSFVFKDLFGAFGRGPADMPAAELVDRLYELAFALFVFFVLLEVVRVMEKLGVLGESCLILYPFAHVVAGAAIAPRGACTFTVCPFRVALGHLPKVPLRRGLGGPGRTSTSSCLDAVTGATSAGGLGAGDCFYAKSVRNRPTRHQAPADGRCWLRAPGRARD